MIARGTGWALCALAALAASARADEVRLKDGRVLVGRVEASKHESLTIQPWDGPVVVDKSEVVRIRTDAELRKELARLARSRGDSAFDHLALAQSAFRFGLERDLWRHLDAVVEDTDRSSGLDRAVLQFMLALEPILVPVDLRQSEPAAVARSLVRRVRPGVGPGERAAVLALLVRLPRADGELRAQARHGLRPDHRRTALAALARRDETPGNAEFVYRSAVLGRTRDDRETAASLLAGSDHAAKATAYIAPGLFHDDPEVRIHTAEAFADLGAADAAVPLLVMAGPLAGTPRAAAGARPGVRAHMAQLQIRSYIRDFDVEIAQAAAVANPTVEGLKTGVVLDAHVAAVVSEHARIATSYRRALRNLTAADPGPDPKEWHEWLRKRDPAAASRAITGRTADARTTGDK